MPPEEKLARDELRETLNALIRSLSAVKRRAIGLHFAWLCELFTRLPYHRDGEAFQQAAKEEPVSSTELDYLLPDKWLAENPMHRWTIDHIRREERTSKSRSKRA